MIGSSCIRTSFYVDVCDYLLFFLVEKGDFTRATKGRSIYKELRGEEECTVRELKINIEK